MNQYTNTYKLKNYLNLIIKCKNNMFANGANNLCVDNIEQYKKRLSNM